MSKKKRSPADLQAIQKHLDYEAGMLLVTAHGLASGIAKGSQLNDAVLESFVIHVRNLVDFLWPESPHNDSIEEWERVRPPLPEILKRARIRAHKLCAHISYDRIRISGGDTAWKFLDIAEEIAGALAVFAHRRPPMPES